MMRWAMLLGLLGLALATGLIVWSGFDAVLQALAQAGLVGIVVTSLFHLCSMLVASYGWMILLTPASRPGWGFFLYMLWLRVSVNNLLPVARIGGEVVAVRVMMQRGIRRGPAISSTVVETTVSVIGQFAFTLLGVALFLMQFSNRDLALQLLLGLLISLLLLGAMIYVQRLGAFGILTKIFTLLFRDKWQKFAGNTAALDRAVHVLYRRRDRIIWCTIAQFVGWLLGSVEIWLALHFIGHPLSLAECIMIEAVVQAAGSAAFIVPGALGVQEAAFLLFGQMLGLTPENAAALAIIRRCRDLLLYVPGLVAWQIQEGKWLFRKRQKETG